MLLAFVLSAATAAADTVELLSGSKLEGTITERTEQSITIKTTVGGRAFTRKLPIDRVLAVTVGAQREVLNAKAGARPSRPRPATSRAATARRTRPRSRP